MPLYLVAHAFAVYSIAIAFAGENGIFNDVIFTNQSQTIQSYGRRGGRNEIIALGKLLYIRIIIA